MTNGHDSGYPRASGLDRIGQLVKLAGRRPVPDPAQMARARAAAYHQWTRVVERRHWRLALWSVAAAAIAAGVLVIAGWSLPRQAPAQTPGPEIADVQTVNGSVVVTSIGANPRVLNQPAPRIRSGDRIETADGGRAALATAGGLSVRLDRATAAVFASADRLVLERGAVYVDSGPGASNAALQVETPLGVIRHTGTQFEVRVDAAEVRVGVREGSVAVDAPGGRVTSRAGEALVLSRGRAPERFAIAASGPEWDWVVGLAQPFQLEGATAQGFLQWVSREQGWRLEFEDASLRARVAGIVLHGSIDSLTPEEALAAVLPTCGLTSRRDGDRLIVSAGSRSWRRTPRRSRRAARRSRSRRPRASSRAPACKRSLSCAERGHSPPENDVAD